jgi:NTP pyrophosphatase (non-canonical NTP hydrolase)
MNLNSYAKQIHETAVKHGWWENNDRNFGEAIALCHSELSESLEEYRNGKKFDEVYFNEKNPEKPEGVFVELADCIVRILDLAGKYNIDMDKIIQQKMNYNESRPYRHGNKKA